MSARDHEQTPVLLYDGDCGFCARSVQFVLAREPAARRAALRFAPLQGAFGARVRGRVPSLDRVDSVIWYDPASDRVLVRSAAGLAVLRHIGGLWGWMGVLGRLVPGTVRDALYDLVARNRHRLAGEACLLPTPEQRDRFLP